MQFFIEKYLAAVNNHDDATMIPLVCTSAFAHWDFGACVTEGKDLPSVLPSAASLCGRPV